MLLQASGWYDAEKSANGHKDGRRELAASFIGNEDVVGWLPSSKHVTSGESFSAAISVVVAPPTD
jgi:hypothetical protein